MHVLVIPSWYPKWPGDIHGCFFREQAIALRRAGHQVGVIDIKLRSLRAWRTFIREPSRIIEEVDEGVQILRYRGIDWFPRLTTLHRWLWLYHGRLLAKEYFKRFGRPEVIHAHSMLNGGILAMQVSSATKVPFLVTEHNSGYAKGTVTSRQIKLVREASQKASKCLAVSLALCKLLEERLASSSTWEEMPNSVERRFLDANLSPVPDQELFTFLSVSLLAPEKAIHNLIFAFQRYFINEPNCYLRIGGDGAERTRLENLVAKLGISHRVKFLGLLSRAEVLEEMKQANAVVVSSHLETFGVVAIEALALGTPVIATRCGGPESIIRPEDGLLVPKDNVTELGRAMLYLRQNIQKFSTDDIRASCRARFSEAVLTRRLSMIYEAIVSQRSLDRTQ